MRTLFIATALLSLSSHAFAGESCKHTRPADMKLNLQDVKTVVFDIGPHQLDLRSGKGSPAAVSGSACASSAELLSGLKLVQERDGDKLIVRPLDSNAPRAFNFSTRYAYFKLSATLPDSVPVQLYVGSGEATVSGAPSLSLEIGSGEAKASRIEGAVRVDVGSGEGVVDNIGALHVDSVGSGELTARDIGSLEAGSIGSGDMSVSNVRGNATVNKVASGNLDIRGAGGDVEVGSVGSGDVDLRDIGGDVRAGVVGSGSIDVDIVRGGLTVTRIGSGSVSHSDISGAVRLPPKK